MTPSHAGVLDAERTPSPYVTSIALGLAAGLIVAGSLCFITLYVDVWYGTIRQPEPEIVYMAADATTGELVCKIYNAGTGLATIAAISVNATQVSPRTPLPVTVYSRAYATVALPHSGPWNGPLQITLGVQDFPGWPYHNYSQRVDLDAASTNPVGGAYPTPIELLAVYLHQHPSEVGFVIIVVLLPAVVAMTLVLRKRGRVSLLVFVDEILAFWIYWFVLVWLITQMPKYMRNSAMLTPFVQALVPTLGSSVLSVLTVYKLLIYRSKRRLPVSRVREQRASVD